MSIKPHVVLTDTLFMNSNTTSSLLHLFPLGIVIDKELKILEIGSTFSKVFGLTRPLSAKISDLLEWNPQIRELQTGQLCSEQVNAKKLPIKLAVETIPLNDSYYFVALTLIQLDSEFEKSLKLNHEEFGPYVSIHQVSEYKTPLSQDYQNLLQEKLRIEKALESEQIGVWELDLTTFAMNADKATFNIFEVPITDLNGPYVHWLNQIHKDDRNTVDSCLQDILSGHKHDFDIRYRVILPTLELKYIHAKAKPYKYLNDKPIRLLGIMRDVTNEVMMEKKLEEGQAQSVQTSQLTALGEMAGGIAHEINNPLAIIEGYASRLEQKMAGDHVIDKQEIIQTLDLMTKSTQRISRIICGLQSFARDGSKDPLENTSLSEVVRETLSYCQSRFYGNNIELITHLDDNIVIACRPVQISQVLLNFINNGFDSVYNQKVEHPYVKISTFVRKNHTVIAIEDNGTGINEEIADKIMSPFFTTKSVGKGTGLGLSISRGIINEHQGDIHLEPIELAQVIESSIKNLEPLVRRSSIDVRWETLPKVMASPMMLGLVFRNLFENSVKFSKPGSSPKISITSNAYNDNTVEILFEDNGIGFDNRFVDKVVKPFVRVHNKRKVNGYGIGLATCKRVLAAHHSELYIKSQPGKGSQFSFFLKVA